METSKTSKTRSLALGIGLMVALIVILFLGGAFRFYNVNWDEGTYHIHPDERHTTMVITAIDWPSNLFEYFDTSHSPLNPRNRDMVYFYGSVPLFLTKAVATLLDRTDYNQIHLVGRVLSGIFDLGTVLLLFFLARRLFDWRVGLVASFLLALTALNIQGSHYFAVDTFLTFFVTLTMWFILDVAEGKGWLAFVGLGIAMGLTLACKVSVFLLVLIVILAVWFRLRRQVGQEQPSGRALVKAMLGLVLAGMLSVLVFRIAQPYAWAGPNYDGQVEVPEPYAKLVQVFEAAPEPIRAVFLPNPQWLADIASAGAQQTGEADLPWGRQWTERTPWLYPLENMVLWGMGVPLGVAAWLGVLFVAAQLVRAWWRRRSQPADGEGVKTASTVPRQWDLVLLVLAWVLLIFFWQGMQFVKSIRYFLPIYPFLAIFAGYLVVSAWAWTKGRGWGAKVAAGGLAAFVLLGTLAWAFAFTRIYSEPVTRVQATRWMYQNIESAATLRYQTAQGEAGQLQLPVPSTHLYGQNGVWQYTSFIPEEDLVATEVVMNDLTGAGEPSEGEFEVRIVVPQDDQTPLTEAEIETVFGGEGGQRHVLDIPDVRLEAGETYLFMSRVRRGAPLISKGAAIANEHFDDPLPFSMDGRIAFGSGPYRGLDLTLYDEDTPEKLEKLLDVLDEADYVSMSSGRLWQSIPRLPMRYPVTTRYYELLFAEELGFEKAAEFHSYPRLFGIEFDDTWAEEQFTVYDHPKVLIYRKTDDFDRERVEALLSEGIVWEEIPHWLNPLDVPEWRREQAREARAAQQTPATEDRIDRTLERTNNLMLTEEQRQVQEQGGTWTVLFDRTSLFNRWPTASWLVLLAVVGLAVLPLSLAIFQWLPDRGYILARPVGVLVLAWLSWVLTNLTPLQYTRGTILLVLALMAVGSWATLLIPGQRRRLADLWRTRKGLVVGSELLFLAFFVLFWLIRWGNPDLWHAWKGGEKPMDFAYLNAVLKSTEFPPYDPWFAGGYLNYYYFGQVMVGTPIKLIGIVPSVAYNLVIPTWFAMTAMGAFSVTYNLVAKGQAIEEEETEPGPEQNHQPPAWRPFLFGLVGALFVAVIGNLGQVALILLQLSEGVLESFQSTIPGFAGLVRTIVGAGEVAFGGRALPIGLDEWYWNASRAIPAGPGEAVITEFPFFTFLYADLHAHLIAMPLTFLSLSLALTLVRQGQRSAGGGRAGIFGRLLLLFLWGLTIGALRTTNSWDVPAQLLVAFGALAIGEYARRGRLNLQLVWAVTWQTGLLFVLSWWVLYWPFWATYAPVYDRFLIWNGTRTPIWAYLVVHGLFLFLIVSYLLARALGRGGGQRPDPVVRRVLMSIRYRKRAERLRHAAGMVGVRRLPVGAWVWIALGLLLLLEVLLLVPGWHAFVRSNPDAVEAGSYAYRGLSVLALGLPVALLGLLLLFRKKLPPVQRLWTYWVLLGLAMSLGVEILALEGDIGRMNTVFKFYLQVWLIWGVAAAAAMGWMLPRLRRWKWGQGIWIGLLSLLIFAAALYPPLATSAKIRDRFDPELGPGLDGWDYMTTAHYWDIEGAEYDLKWDLEAIEWLVNNVVGSPVILEGHAPEYRWGARYSVNTGLPAVLGWNWHQRQQRGIYGAQEVWNRAGEIATIYNSTDSQEAKSLLDRYNVRYVIVGPLERVYYQQAGLEKFEQMVAEGLLGVAFRNDQVTIYEVQR